MLTSSVSLILRGPGVRAQGSATLEDYGHLTIGFASKFAEGVLSHSHTWKCTNELAKKALDRAKTSHCLGVTSLSVR